jgi:hypothetical membrane protein
VLKKVYPLFGIMAALFYISAVLIGGSLRKDYSHVSNMISELTVANAPYKTLMDIIFTLYNLCIAIFGFSTYHYLLPPRSKKMKTASIMLGSMGILGLLMFLFPQDSRDALVTVGGIIHIVLAGIMSLLTILIIFLAGLSFENESELKSLKIYTIFSGLVVVLTGGLTAALTASGSAYMGVFERLTIGTFILWVMIFALKLFTLIKENNGKNITM